jgi:hypothetical protein
MSSYHFRDLRRKLRANPSPRPRRNLRLLDPPSEKNRRQSRIATAVSASRPNFGPKMSKEYK